MFHPQAMRSRFRRLTLFLTIGLILLIDSMSFGAERGINAYLPGFRNFEAGIIPTKTGLYLRSDIIGYFATEPRAVINGFPVENINTDAVLGVVEPLYVLPKKLFGATHAIVITQPFIWTTLSGRIIGTDLEPSGSGINPGDPAISPLYLGWNKGKLHYNTNVAIFIPTGDYDIGRVANVSRNYWTIDPEFGITYLDPKTGWDFSGVVGYSFNFENPATDYTSGDVFHLDYAIGKRGKNGLKPGIIGYASVQVTPDSGPGAIFGAFKSEVYGIGPALKWYMDPSSSLMLRYLHEFGAVNHLEGDQLALTYKVAF